MDETNSAKRCHITLWTDDGVPVLRVILIRNKYNVQYMFRSKSHGHSNGMVPETMKQ